MTQPNITLRLNNPRINDTLYMIDVELKSDIPTTFQGMNMRFFYDSGHFDTLVRFKNFTGGYGPLSPTTDIGHTYGKVGNAASKALFSFTNAPTYLNGAVNLNDPTKAIILTDTYTKLFEIQFEIKNINLLPSKPPIVLDLESNTSRGGFLPGSDGIVMAVVKNATQDGYVLEHVEQYNWVYTGDGLNYPFGKPVI